jgi:hypothetical protein
VTGSFGGTKPEVVMEPVSVLSAVDPILKAGEAIKALVVGADQLAPDDARYYGTWINVAGEAIRGLVQEYIEVLIEAAHCDPLDPGQREQLLKRVHRYVHGEVLRPRLKEAIERLRAGRPVLKQHAERLLIWLRGRRGDRELALARYDQLLDQLTGYLGALGDYEGPSAHALEEVLGIHADVRAGSREALAARADRLLMNLDKTSLLEITGGCGRTIETLRVAFR